MKLSSRQIIDNSLFLYGGLVTLTLTVIALFNLKNGTSFFTLLLFLPVSGYFVVKTFLSFGRLFHIAINTDRENSPYFSNFSLLTFLNQPDISFSINLTLLALSITIILFKISLNLIK
jgi:hypothetical protein